MASTDLSKVLSSMNQSLVQIVQDVQSARESVRSGSVTDGVADLHEQLVDNRAQIERMEAMVAYLVVLKSRTAQAVAERKAMYDDAYMKAATKSSVKFQDFSSAKEKDAHYNLSAVEETLNLRKAEANHRDVDAAWDFCRILLRGAEGVQRDLEIRVRMITLTSSLER